MNLQEIRNRLNKLANQTTKRKDLWKPKDVHTIRCLPYPHGDEPFLELGFHYELGKTRALLCPNHNYGDDCAVCEAAAKLRSWTDESGVDKPEKQRHDDFEIFKKIQVKERYYIPMVERGHEGEGPKFWAFGKSIYEKLLKMCIDEEMNEDRDDDGGTLVLTSVDNAYDITVDFAQPNNKDGKGNAKTFPITDIKEKKRASKLGLSEKETEELLGKIPNIESVYDKVSSKEVEKIFSDFMNEGAPEVDGSKEDAGVEYKSNSAEKPVEGGQSIDEAFGEMAGK